MQKLGRTAVRPYIWIGRALRVLILCAACSRAYAQDTTGVYPWHLSYFPYITASPNDGVMGLGRVVLFRQSRWDDRVSLHDEVAPILGLMCQRAVQEPAPYAAWPPELRRIVGKEYREVRFVFHYN